MVLMKRDGSGDVSEMTGGTHHTATSGWILSLHTSAVSANPLMSRTASISGVSVTRVKLLHLHYNHNNIGPSLIM